MAFDAGARDEEHDLRLISKVNAEIQSKGYLTKPTFLEIINGSRLVSVKRR